MTQMLFTKTNKGFYEFLSQVSADFNVRVVQKEPKLVTVEISTENDGIFDMKYSKYDILVDEDFNATVYPKYIRVRVWSEPVKGVITEVDE